MPVSPNFLLVHIYDHLIVRKVPDLAKNREHFIDKMRVSLNNYRKNKKRSSKKVKEQKDASVPDKHHIISDNSSSTGEEENEDEEEQEEGEN